MGQAAPRCDTYFLTLTLSPHPFGVFVGGTVRVSPSDPDSLLIRNIKSLAQSLGTHLHMEGGVLDPRTPGPCRLRGVYGLSTDNLASLWRAVCAPTPLGVLLWAYDFFSPFQGGTRMMRDGCQG